MYVLHRVLVQFCVILQVQHLVTNEVNADESVRNSISSNPSRFQLDEAQNHPTNEKKENNNLPMNAHLRELIETNEPEDLNQKDDSSGDTHRNNEECDNLKSTQCRRYIERSLLRCLTYLERQWQSVENADVQNLLLGLTISQAQLQSKPTPDLALEYLKLRMDKVHHSLLSKLTTGPHTKRKSSLWNQMFHSALWQIRKPLRKLAEHRSSPTARPTVQIRRSSYGDSFELSRNFNEDASRPDERDYGVHFERPYGDYGVHFERSYEAAQHHSKFTPRRESNTFRLFRETRLPRESDRCLLGLLADCSVREGCAELMMEQAGGYSLAHQTLYFILARQNNCTLWNATNLVSTQNLIHLKCQRMADVNNAILKARNFNNAVLKARNFNKDFKATTNLDIHGEDSEIKTSHTMGKGNVDNEKDINEELMTLSRENEIDKKESGKDSDERSESRMNTDVFGGHSRENFGGNQHDAFKNNFTFRSTRNLNDDSDRYDQNAFEKDRKLRNTYRISPTYVDLYIENSVLCGMEYYVDFLSPKTGREVLEHQTDRGCFARFGKECDHHMSALSIAYLSIQLGLQE